MHALPDCQPPLDDGAAQKRIVELREQMGRLSRRIGEARKAGEDVQSLMERMRELSAERKHLERSLQAAKQQQAQAQRPAPEARESVGAAPSAAARPAAQAHTPEQVEVGPATNAAEWDAYVQSHPRSSPYHLYCWKTIIESSFSHCTHYLVARDGAGQVVGIMPLVRQKSLLFGHFMTSVPFVNYGGPLGDSAEVERELMLAAGRIAAEQHCRHVEFRDDLPRPNWASRLDKVSMRLMLPETARALWESFPSKVRAQVRRADRENPHVVVGGRELLGDFYRVFSHNMRDLGTPVYRPEFFDNIARALGSRLHLVVAYVGHAPVSAGVLIRHRDTIEIPWASTRRAALSSGINMLFYWRILCFAIESGARIFDFGRSTQDSGTYRFKKQWGAEPTQLHWHYWLAEEATVPQLNPDNPKYRVLIGCWRKLPVWASKTIGPPIARALP